MSIKSQMLTIMFLMRNATNGQTTVLMVLFIIK